MRKFFIAVIAGALSLSLFTACSGKEKKESSTEKTTEEKTEKTTTAQETTTELSQSDKETLKYLEKEMTEAYAGVTEDDIMLFYSGNEDGSLGILLFADPNTKETATFVGTVEQTGKHRLTITDDSTQSTMTFDITRLEDNTLLLDLGEDLGQAQIEQCEISEVLDAMKTISNNGIPVL